MQVRVRENNIKELKVHILNRDIDKIIETLADEQAIDAYAQAIKARDLLYNTKQKEEITALIESYCACESNVEPWQMMANDGKNGFHVPLGRCHALCHQRLPWSFYLRSCPQHKPL